MEGICQIVWLFFITKFTLLRRFEKFQHVFMKTILNYTCVKFSLVWFGIGNRFYQLKDLSLLFFCQLLCFSPRERLGDGMNGAEDIKSHPFFQGIDWHSLENSWFWCSGTGCGALATKQRPESGIGYSNCKTRHTSCMCCEWQRQTSNFLDIHCIVCRLSVTFMWFLHCKPHTYSLGSCSHMLTSLLKHHSTGSFEVEAGDFSRCFLKLA